MTGMRTLPLAELLAKQDGWIEAMRDYLRGLANNLE